MWYWGKVKATFVELAGRAQFVHQKV